MWNELPHFFFSPQGGRRVLHLYGYTSQQIDGLSFPDEVNEPDADKVAALTLEVMMLRSEVDMLVKVFVCNRSSGRCSFCVNNSLYSISYTVSVCLGHTSSPRTLQRHHPIYRPAGLYKHVLQLYTRICVSVYVMLHVHIYSNHNHTSQLAV